MVVCIHVQNILVQIQRRERGFDPSPWKITKIKGVLAILIRSPEKSQRYQASIQRWPIIGPLAKRHLNGVSLAGRWWPIYSDIWIIYSLVSQQKNQKKKKKKRKKKNRYQIWTHSDKLFWIRAWCTFYIHVQNGLLTCDLLNGTRPTTTASVNVQEANS